MIVQGSISRIVSGNMTVQDSISKIGTDGVVGHQQCRQCVVSGI